MNRNYIKIFTSSNFGVIRGIGSTTGRTSLFGNSGYQNNVLSLSGNTYQLANYAIKQAVGRRIKPNIFVQSPGQVFENAMPSPIVSTLLSPSLWFDQAKYYYKTFGSYSMIKSKLKKLTDEKFTVKQFLEESKEKYTKLNQTMLSGNIDKDITTIYFHSVLSTQFKSQPKYIKSSWSAELNKPKAIWSRSGQIKTSLSGDTEFFAQICVEFSGTQSMSLVDTRNGTTLSEAVNVPFKDIYVFERCLSSLPSEWKICAQVTPTTANNTTN
ncbi:hypothetical protein PPL_05089 [Heterostelium album PN500]|uniref:Tim44-like domain-containing protein n=1 Tax=Heterostelium pallidum (strain ATCC 26659 / Pp 5 / PN500) TaxID=670386 RepID=D3B9E5_HETP5|nr:hypothetical protein PPL_05089 [Heterostelium album PN500]EFA81857.1 hypothetical protein PPL_05089 [Heterostelium album PN500]|eukprot:XP_020433974.1 hypothetical protein PPL_05089 [Heterostelium album PN500]